VKNIYLFCGLLLLILLSVTANAQTPYFEKYYDTGVDDAGIGLNSFSDGRILLAGNRRRGSGSSTNQGFYLLLSANGTEENIFYQDTPLRNSLGRVLPLPNNQSLVIGAITALNPGTYDDWVYLVINENGTVINSKSYGAIALDEEPEQILQLQDGRFLAAGGEGRNNNGYLTLFDENLELVWRQDFSAPGTRFNRLNAVTEIPDGFIVSGHFSISTSRVWGTFAARYNTDGSLAWSNQYTQPGMQHQIRNSIVLSDNGVLVFDESLIDAEQSITMLELGYDGEVENYLALPQSGTNELLRNAIRLRNGNILLCGYSETPGGSTKGFLVEITDAGVVVWSKTYGADEDVFFFDVVERTDGIPGFYAVGRSRNCESNNTEIYLLALDENGEGAGDCASSPWSLTTESREITASPYGQSQTSTVPEGLMAPMTSGSVVSIETECVQLFVDPDLSSGGESPLIFKGREDCSIDFAPVVDADVAFSVDTRQVDSVVLILSSETDPQADWLSFAGAQSSLIRGQNTARLTIINDGTLSTEQLSNLLRQIVLRNPNESVGTRTLEIVAYTGCEESDLTTSTFNAIGAILPNGGLPETLSTCNDNPVLVDATTIGATSYRWSNGDTTVTSLLTGEGEYFVTISNSCSSTIDTITVMNASVELTAPEDQSLMICLGDSSVIDLTVSGADDYTINGLQVEPEGVFRIAGEYEVTAANSCDTVRSNIQVTTEDCCKIYLPNAFSPNDDGINDVFRAFPDTDNCSLVSNYNLRIFNRWGGEVYAGNTLTDGWDGKTNGEPAGNGYYVYTLSYFNGLSTLSVSEGVVLLR